MEEPFVQLSFICQSLVSTRLRPVIRNDQNTDTKLLRTAGEKYGGFAHVER